MTATSTPEVELAWLERDLDDLRRQIRDLKRQNDILKNTIRQYARRELRSKDSWRGITGVNMYRITFGFESCAAWEVPDWYVERTKQTALDAGVWFIGEDSIALAEMERRHGGRTTQ